MKYIPNVLAVHNDGNKIRVLMYTILKSQKHIEYEFE